MASSRIILAELRKVIQGEYPAQVVQRRQESAYFEKVVAEALSRILYLPFHTSESDNPRIPYRVTWKGSITPLSKADSGVPDAIAYCYGFYLIIEATRKTGSNQWTQEFAQSIRHCEDFCTQNNIQRKDIFVLMICNELHRDTYRSIKSNPRQEYRVAPIAVPHLARILQTSILSFTLRHLEFRELLSRICKCIKDSSSVEHFSKSAETSVTDWQRDVLKLEKRAFIGVKSYEAMRKIGRNAIAVSEILQRLQKHPFVMQYLNIVGEKLTADEVEESLVQQSLAHYLISTIRDDEPLFEPVPSVDFARRGIRLIDEVERIK
jgi:hypothetical protein